MSNELPQLSDADRAAIERIWNAAAIGADPCEALARYFLAAGLERAAEKPDPFTTDLSERFQHVKTGNIYFVHGQALMEATQESMTVYESEETCVMWIRPTAEFFDGRFAPINEAAERAIAIRAAKGQP